jgi:hypothetical protein
VQKVAGSNPAAPTIFKKTGFSAVSSNGISQLLLPQILKKSKKPKKFQKTDNFHPLATPGGPCV